MKLFNILQIKKTIVQSEEKPKGNAVADNVMKESSKRESHYVKHEGENMTCHHKKNLNNFFSA